MAEYIDTNKTTHKMWQNLYKLEDELEKKHSLDICERNYVRIGFEAGLQTVVNMPTIDIVTCGECKWLLKAKVGKGRCVMHFADVAEDYFCADGEREE